MREVEAAIGYDCRRLHDGRRAVFRHTFVRKRAIRDLLERRDLIGVLGSSYMAMASMASDPRMNFDASVEVVRDSRASMVKAAFPYLSLEEKPKTYDDYSEYFDELDELERQSSLDGKGPNDIMDAEK